MKIYSNFKDYYDCALGSFIESDAIVIRKQSSAFEYYRNMPDMKSYDGEYNVIKNSSYGTSYSFEPIHMIGFCGTWYFYIVLDYKIVYKSFDEIVKNNEKVLWSNIYNEYVNPNDSQYWSELFTKYGPVLHCMYKPPAKYESGQVKQHVMMQIDIWPELKKRKFINVKNPYTALWEIEHWLDSRARPDEAVVPVGDDITRLQAYGFDKKISFRKAKEK